MLIRIDKSGEHSGRAWLALLLAGAWAAWVVPAHAATCGPDAPTLARADVAFVGTLTSANAVGDHATFAVEEVWGGAGLSAVVAVTGVPGRWAMPPPGTDPLRYLVVAEVIPGGLRDTGDCAGRHPSLSIIWDPSLEVLRPPTAHPPTSVGGDTIFPVELLVAAGLITVLALVAAIAFRPGRSPEG
ncbi:MAG: hypothetical protein M3P32_08425 [Chloroflexota bacterium]|nr:hypothetical protein [Chloroflexota bacterium]